MSNLFEQLAIVKQELAKLEKMMHGNMLQLPWDKAPEWAQWAAMDELGSWYWHEQEPYIEPTAMEWLSYHSVKDFSFPTCTNWKESKRKRP